MSRGPLHDDDIVLPFEATQEARHAAVLRINEMGRALVERLAAEAALPDADGVLPDRPCLRLVVGIDREGKSDKQRKFLHGVVLKQISEQVRMPDGSRYLIPIWKEYFRSMFLADRWESVRIPGERRDTTVCIRQSTEELSVKQYSELIEKVIAHAATEWNVVFEIDPKERDEVRYVRPPRTRRATAEGEPA